jgi:hypothetical protein
MQFNDGIFVFGSRQEAHRYYDVQNIARKLNANILDLMYIKMLQNIIHCRFCPPDDEKSTRPQPGLPKLKIVRRRPQMSASCP